MTARWSKANILVLGGVVKNSIAIFVSLELHRFQNAALGMGYWTSFKLCSWSIVFGFGNCHGTGRAPTLIWMEDNTGIYEGVFQDGDYDGFFAGCQDKLLHDGITMLDETLNRKFRYHQNRRCLVCVTTPVMEPEFELLKPTCFRNMQLRTVESWPSQSAALTLAVHGLDDANYNNSTTRYTLTKDLLIGGWNTRKMKSFLTFLQRWKSACVYMSRPCSKARRSQGEATFDIWWIAICYHDEEMKSQPDSLTSSAIQLGDICFIWSFPCEKAQRLGLYFDCGGYWKIKKGEK